MHPILTIALLGEFRINFQGAPVTSLSADRIQSLLTYLLLHRGRPQSRQHIAFLLWPDSSEGQARTNLRNLLHSLRNALPAADTFLEITNLTLHWKSDTPFRLDVSDFQTALEASRNTAQPDAVGDWLRQAIDLYKGDLLPGHYDDWLVAAREEMRHSFIEALVRLIEWLESRGDVREAIRQAGRLLAENPLNEVSYVLLMRLHACNGDRSSVRRAYEQCVAVLRRELNIEPSQATQNAYRQWQQAEPPVTPPALEMPTTPKRKLAPPRLTTPFVGREMELAELAQLLDNPDCRLLTITGPGGMGKTLLAQQTANGHAPLYEDGAAFVPLAPLTDPARLASTIAHVLELLLSGNELPEPQLLRALSAKTLLLVLDNFEHLLDGADLVAQILAHAPHVKILVTSRERLNLREEWVYDLHGLSLPPQPTDPQWAESSAVQLFMQSARRVKAGFAPQPEEAAAITHICHLVEGMPLGIQLAAGWVRVLEPTAIATEIQKDVAFLETTHRNVPQRHHSIRAIFDHSWRLLSPAEQHVLAALSVFRGGFDRTFAAAVAGATLPMLSSLVDKSLVRRAENQRYSLHELIRQYADVRLQEAGDWQAMHERHWQCYMESVAAKDQALFGPMQPALLEQLDHDHDNLRAALTWGLRTPDRASMDPLIATARAIATLARFWYLRGHLVEGWQWVEAALARLDDLPPASPQQQIRARLLFGAGELVGSGEMTNRAAAFLEESLALARQLDDKRGVVMAQHKLAETILGKGEIDQAEALVTESLPLARALDDSWLVGRSLSILTTLAVDKGNVQRAELLGSEALTMFRQQNEPGAMVYILNILGQLAIFQGDRARGIAMLEEALTINQTVTRLQMGAAWTLRNLGMGYFEEGDVAQALRCFRQSLRLRQELRQLAGIAWAMEGLAEVAVHIGQPARAAQLWGCAAALRQQVVSEMSTMDRTRFEKWSARARQQLGQTAFETYWQQGHALSTDEAVAVALMD